jgi:hypothetical protein
MWQTILTGIGVSILTLVFGVMLVAQIGLAFGLGATWQNILTWGVGILFVGALGLAWTQYWQVSVGIVLGVMVLLQLVFMFLA